MMGWGYSSMMDGYGFFGFLTWVVVFVDLVLLGVYLLKKLR